MKLIDVDLFRRENGFGEYCSACEGEQGADCSVCAGAFGRCYEGNTFYRGDICEMLDEAPVVTVTEIVRCKDCVFFDKTEMLNCKYASMESVTPEDYCSHASRKMEVGI